MADLKTISQHEAHSEMLYIPKIASERNVSLQSDPIAVPDDATVFICAVHRIAVPDTKDVISTFRAELSLDGGNTWSPSKADGRESTDWQWGKFPLESNIVGGISIDPAGNPCDFSRFYTDDMPKAEGRLIRIVFTPAIAATVKVEVFFKAPE